jgi:hypothetical protein
VDDTVELAPLCFVLMPFGKKMDAAGRVTNFESVYERIVAQAVIRAGLEPNAPTRRRSAVLSISRCSSG